MQLLDITGVAFLHRNKNVCPGEVPGKKELSALRDWLQRKSISRVFATASLSETYPPADVYKDKASGLVVLPIFPHKGEFLVGFTSEVIRTVNWGGNPNEAIQFEKDKKTIIPATHFLSGKKLLRILLHMASCSL